MLARVRSLWLAGGGAVALTIALSGVVAAATVLTAMTAPATAPTAPIVDTASTFEDLDGNGVDDDCQTEEVVANPSAAASAEAAADLDGDGTISVSEAAQSGRTGGANCNHGGYVSNVAHGDCAADAPEEPVAPTASVQADLTVAVDEDADEAVEADEPTDCDSADEETEDADEDTPTECETVTPTVDEAPVDPLDPAELLKNAHGKKVSAVAHSDAVGGKNCNHGGAVSEAAKKDQEAAKAAREAAKAEREAAREARRDAREASKAGKHHGKPGG
jgi:hypothetical protein